MFFQLIQWLSQMLFMALHVLRAGSFPKPLAPEEERELLCRYREQNDADARARLIEHNLRLVAHIAKKYSHGTTDPDDLISIGTIGLIKAVETFDCDKGNRFVSYSSRCIENATLSRMGFWFESVTPCGTFPHLWAVGYM
ncbi:MAG: sigma-70 family RNA polymerase sigma factor [Clostridia bacterium]|nr:sigma-70 family RNA polymerase sigma factor [Clostridia bacterium]